MDYQMNKSSAQDIPALTGLRGAAALMVVLYHANQSSIKDIPNYYDSMIFHGQLFVDLFFILSGFVMSHVYLSASPEFSAFRWWSFYVARFARVYPLHAATAIASAVGIGLLSLKSGVAAPELTVGEALREATLSQAMPWIWQDTLWNSPSWSVSVEFWSYFFVFPMLIPLTKLMTPKIAVAASFVMLTCLVFWLESLSGEPARGGPAFARALVGFFSGWAIWLVWRSNTLWKPGGWTVDILAVLILLVIQALSSSAGNPWWVIFLFPAFIYGIVSTSSISSRMLESKPLIFLGDISYSMYLIHPLILKSIQIASYKIDFLHHNPVAFIFIGLGIAIPVSYASYRYFEMPARVWIRKALVLQRVQSTRKVEAERP